MGKEKSSASFLNLPSEREATSIFINKNLRVDLAFSAQAKKHSSERIRKNRNKIHSGSQRCGEGPRIQKSLRGSKGKKAKYFYLTNGRIKVLGKAFPVDLRRRAMLN